MTVLSDILAGPLDKLYLLLLPTYNETSEHIPASSSIQTMSGLANYVCRHPVEAIDRAAYKLINRVAEGTLEFSVAGGAQAFGDYVAYQRDKSHDEKKRAKEAKNIEKEMEGKRD